MAARADVLTNSTMIEVCHLRKSFAGKVVLEDVNFRATRCCLRGDGRQWQRQIDNFAAPYWGAQAR
jgi:carbon monoxide dehydrogenase subunit G